MNKKSQFIIRVGLIRLISFALPVMLAISSISANAQSQSLTNSTAVSNTSKTNISKENTAASKKLSGYLNNYVNYSADFQQSTFDARGGLIRQSQGKVMIARPGRFRWQTSSPSKQLVIANGNKLWIYDIELAQVTEQDLSQQGLTPGVLLSRSISQLAQQFNVSEQQDGWFTLKPKQQTAGFESASLQFTKGKLTGLKLLNPLGQTSEFKFTNIKSASKPFLNNDLFDFLPPPGVDVLN